MRIKGLKHYCQLNDRNNNWEVFTNQNLCIGLIHHSKEKTIFSVSDVLQDQFNELELLEILTFIRYIKYT